MRDCASASTASSRPLISSRSSKGCSTQLRSSRPPMAVLVLSSRFSSVPFFPFQRRLSVSSRFRRVFGSSSIRLPLRAKRSVVMCSRLFFWVSPRYFINAPAARVAKGCSSSPSPARCGSLKWSQSTSPALCSWNQLLFCSLITMPGNSPAACFRLSRLAQMISVGAVRKISARRMAIAGSAT